METPNNPQGNIKQIIANNLELLMKVYGKTRKQVCADLDISYTTFCDWINARSYPRMEALECLGRYFRISVRNILVNIADYPSVVDKLTAYAAAYGVSMGEDNTPLFTANEAPSSQNAYPVEMITGQYYTYEAPSTLHQRYVAELIATISFFIKRNHTGHVLFPGPFNVELPTNPETIVVPDITVIHDKAELDAYGYVGVPDWIIEVSSSTSRSRDTYLKKAVYEESGVPEYWVIDPEHFFVTVHTLVSTDENFYRTQTYPFTENIASGVLFGLILRIVDLDVLS